ncbi:MAG TPA: SpoIID/LytB domain-containing protein [Ignavibacteria bacterium]|nr:SpoIID/LytB domain-containing protein [Ignavibacteria bacterium]
MLINFLNSFQISRQRFFTYKYILFFSIPFLLLISFAGCSSSKKFSDEDYNYNSTAKFKSPDIKVLLDDKPKTKNITLGSNVVLSSADKRIAIVNEGNTLYANIDGDKVIITIGDNSFTSESFKIETKDRNTFLSYNGKSYRGAIKFFSDGSKLIIINELPLEDYLKGVLPLEMPIGKGDENVEALKAMAVTARTYSFSKMNKNNKTFDVYLDVRDQVYGGVKAEKALTNKIIDETKGLILTYDGKPAIVFYSASGGGYTENYKNVFGNFDIPYLRGVKDGDKPYGSIMPNFEWTEKYTEGKFLSMLLNAGKIKNVNYTIDDIEIVSRFASGRVNELKISLESDENGDKEIILKGNRIRSIIRRANGGILRSTMIEIEMDDDKNIEITGKGNGHGVGLSQWGAIYLSHEGTDYKEILSHYFPGTEIKPISYDN